DCMRPHQRMDRYRPARMPDLITTPTTRLRSRYRGRVAGKSNLSSINSSIVTPATRAYINNVPKLGSRVPCSYPDITVYDTSFSSSNLLHICVCDRPNPSRICLSFFPNLLGILRAPFPIRYHLPIE